MCGGFNIEHVFISNQYVINRFASFGRSICALYLMVQFSNISQVNNPWSSDSSSSHGYIPEMSLIWILMACLDSAPSNHCPLGVIHDHLRQCRVVSMVCWQGTHWFIDTSQHFIYLPTYRTLWWAWFQDKLGAVVWQRKQALKRTNISNSAHT